MRQPTMVIQNRTGQWISITVPDAVLAGTLLGWTTVAANLNEEGTVSGTTLYKWQYGGRDATKAEIDSVLARVDLVTILGSIRREMPQTTWLDEVTVTAPSPSAAVRARPARRR